jgi:hypothetical protein
MLYLKESPEGIIFKIRVQPRSSKNIIAGLFEDALRIKITAPPVEGAANVMCVRFLSKCLCLPAKRLEIVSGLSGRTKHVLLRYGEDTSKNEKESLKSKVKSLTA